MKKRTSSRQCVQKLPLNLPIGPFSGGGGSGGLVSALLRMVGIGESQLGVMAMNVLVYLGEILTKRILGSSTAAENDIPEYRALVQEVTKNN